MLKIYPLDFLFENIILELASLKIGEKKVGQMEKSSKESSDDRFRNFFGVGRNL